MIAGVASILIYLGMLYFKLWEIVPQEHRWWIGLALVLLFLWSPVERVLVIRRLN